MSKKSFYRRLVFKIPLQMSLLILGVMLVIGIALSTLLFGQMTTYVESEIELLAQSNANTVTEYFNTMEARCVALAEEVARYEYLDEEALGKMMVQAVQTTLNDERLYAAYISFEPNSFFADTPNGRSYYAYREDAGLALDVDDENYDYEECYYLPKDTLSVHLLEPYEFELSNGNTIWMITIAAPILDASNKFVGIINIDLEADVLLELPYNLGGYESSYSYILTNQGNYITNTADDSLVGAQFSGEGAITDKIMAAVIDGESGLFKGMDVVHAKDSFIVHKPISVKGVSETWSSGFVVSKSEALKAANRILVLISVLAVAGIILFSLFAFFLSRKSLKPIGKLVAYAKDIGDGLLNQDIDIDTKDEFGELAAIFSATCQRLSTYISEISLILANISEGDLRTKVVNDYMGDFLPLKEAMNRITDSLNHTLKQISVAADQVAAGAVGVSDGSQVLAQGSTEQASSIEELASSVEIVTEQVKQNAANANSANSQMDIVGAQMEKSNTEMGQMLTAMSDINVASTKIATIIKTIEDIAFQTNILALNAAVEAARAGSAGKGFAVVAEEVRNLAGKSAQAATDTTALIGNSIASVENGLQIADETAQTLLEAVDSTKQVLKLIEEISKASSEQAASLGQISQGVEQISAVVQTNSATAEESAAASEELSGQSDILRQEVDKFQIAD